MAIIRGTYINYLYSDTGVARDSVNVETIRMGKGTWFVLMPLASDSVLLVSGFWGKHY